MKEPKLSPSQREEKDFEILRFGARLWLQRLMAWIREHPDPNEPIPDEIIWS